MADREKVIKWLDVCKTADRAVGLKEDYPCRECPYKDSPRCMRELVADALALLKEQEEQKRKWLQNIADNQLANAPKHDRDDFMQLDEHLEYRYQLGVYDGLQMAYDILTEGR